VGELPAGPVDGLLCEPLGHALLGAFGSVALPELPVEPELPLAPLLPLDPLVSGVVELPYAPGDPLVPLEGSGLAPVLPVPVVPLAPDEDDAGSDGVPGCPCLSAISRARSSMAAAFAGSVLSVTPVLCAALMPEAASREMNKLRDTFFMKPSRK
jgi:hypothetical protein